jgi:hypothetical protein
MANNTYNGWKNRETWLVNVWHGDNWTCRADVEMTQIVLEEAYDKLASGFFRDAIDLECIDWKALQEHAEANA